MKECQTGDCASKNITLAEWLIYYLKTYSRPSRSAHSRYHWDICFKHILPFIGATDLEKITAEDIRRFVHYKSVSGNLRNGSPLSERSVKRINNQLELAMKQAYRDGIIQKDPFT